MRTGVSTARRGTLDSRTKRPITAKPPVASRPSLQKTQPLTRRPSNISKPQGSQRQVPVLSPNSQTPTRKSQRQVIPPDKIITDAVDSVLLGKELPSFAQIREAARSISSASAGAIFDHVRQTLSDKLSDINLSSIQAMLEHWKVFTENAKRLDAFLSFINKEDDDNMLPKWKFIEGKKKRQRIVRDMAASLWREQVHPDAMHCLGPEMEAASVKTMTGSADAETRELFALLRSIGTNPVDPVRTYFTRDFISRKSSMTDTEIAEFLIRETKKLSAVFPIDELQKFTIAPYLKDVVNGLVIKRLTEPLVSIKSFILPEYTSDYTDAIMAYFNSLSMPVDFFSIASLLEFFSAVLFNDAPIKRAVTSYIMRADSQFPQELISVLFSHSDLSLNVRELAPIIPLYTDNEALSKELVRGFLLRILQKKTRSKDEELKFLETLMLIFSAEQLQPVRTMLRDIDIRGNFLIINNVLSSPLIADDSAVFPEDLASEAETELRSYIAGTVNRNYKLSASFSVAFVKIKWGEEERFVTMSVLQYHLMKIISSRSNDFKKTGASSDCLTLALKCLVKAGLVKKVSALFVMSPTPPKEKRLNVYNSAINVRPERARAKPRHDHSMSIQAVIAKEMKALRRMDRHELEEKVMSELSVKFNIRDGEIDKAVKGMIDSEFLEEDKRDPRYLIYIP